MTVKKLLKNYKFYFNGIIFPERVNQVIDKESKESLEMYKAIFGCIIFPNDDERIRREIYANPAGWMYSYDGLKWEQAPMDIGKIDYVRALFRRIPEGVILGVNDHIRNNPRKYQYSHDNGHTWSNLIDHSASALDYKWIYHGTHETTWFREKACEEVLNLPQINMQKILQDEYIYTKIDELKEILAHCQETHYAEELAGYVEVLQVLQHIADLWQEFGDVPMNPETECIEEEWNYFPAGTNREEIWHWFESCFGISVAQNLMNV